MKRKSPLIFSFVIIIMLIASVVHYLDRPNQPYSPTPVKGVVDLQNWSFEKNGAVSLSGEWSFYFNKFLSHEDFVKGVATPVYYIKVPGTKKSMNAVKPFPSNKFYGTMRLVIKLPPQTKTYGLRSNFVLSSHKLYINGEYFGEIGKIGNSKENSIPYYRIMNSYFQPDKNELELIYQTADFSFGDCAIIAPRIGLANQITNEACVGLGRDLFLFGMLLIMGIYHLGLYYMRQKDRAPLYFGIFCLAFSIRMLIVGERYLPSIITWDYVSYVKVAYICVFVGFYSLCCFIYHSLPSLFKKWVVQLSVFCGISATIFSAILPYKMLDYLLLVYSIIGFPLIGFAIIRLIYGVWHKHPFSSGVLIGFCSLAIALVNDLIYQFTLSNHGSMIPLGVSIFTFTQAYTLSAKFSNAFTQAEQLSEENASILVELTNMNANLESIVDERTADLKNAMLEMDIMSKIDYLTKLPNRRLMFQNIDKLIEEKQSFFIALSDIDKFKNVNDSFGHDKGDEILKRVAVVMTNTLGKDGFVGRWGGEEFLMVFHTNQTTDALRIANNVCEKISECTYEGLPVQITMTVGICAYVEGMAVDTCIANADNALYVGKANGRNQCHLYGEKVIKKP